MINHDLARLTITMASVPCVRTQVIYVLSENAIFLVENTKQILTLSGIRTLIPKPTL